MGPPSPHIAGHIALYGNRLLHGQENQWKTTWRSYGRFECAFGYLWNVHEYDSSSSSSSRKELSLENDGTAFQGNKKADQWSDRNHLHKPDQFPRFKVCIGKLIAKVELINIPLPKSMSPPTLCSVWEKWETILFNPGSIKFNGIRTTIISAN